MAEGLLFESDPALVGRFQPKRALTFRKENTNAKIDTPSETDPADLAWGVANGTAARQGGAMSISNNFLGGGSTVVDIGPSVLTNP